MRTKIALLLTAVLIAGLAAVFANGFYDEINGGASVSDAYDDDTSSDGGQKTLETSQDKWRLTDPSEFDPNYTRSSIAQYITTDPYILKEEYAELVIVGTIAFTERVVGKVPNTESPWYYAKFLVDVDQIVSGSYERDTIDVVIVGWSKIKFQKGDQAFFILTRAHEYYGDSWIASADWYGVYKISGDDLIGTDITIDKDELIN